MNRFGNYDLVIADTFCVALNFTIVAGLIVAGLSELLAGVGIKIGIKIPRLSNGDTGIGIGAAANVEF